MRILWITPGFAASETDHNCIPPLQLLARGLLQRGIELHIIALEYPFCHTPYDWYGARVYPCNGQNRRIIKLRTLWRANTPPFQLEGTETTVHSFWLGWASFVGERMARRYGIRHFTTLMGQDVLPQNRWFQRALNAERCARLVAVSAFQNRVLAQHTGFQAGHIIPWGLPGVEIPASLPASRPLDLLGAGSLVAVKDWEKWLGVVALAAQKKPDLRAELIGDGPERKKLESLTRRLGLAGNVRFAGNLPRQEALARMRQAKVLLHTAHFESFGFVLAEAAANGCRIVSTPVGIATEVGVTAEGIAELAALLTEQLGLAIRQQPFVPLEMEQTVEAYLNIYFPSPDVSCWF